MTDLAATDPAFLIYAALAAFVAFLSTSTLGLGSALILTPLLMVELSAGEAVAAIAPAMFINSSLTAWVHRAEVPWRLIRLTAAVAVPLTVATAALAASVPGWLVQVLIAATIVLALGMKRGLGRDLAGGSAGAALWGAVAGASGGIAGTFGPPLAISFLARGLTGAAFVGATTAVGTAINFVRIPAYVAAGVFDTALAPLVVVVAASGVLAVRAGKMLLERMDPARFRVYVDVLLGAIAVVLVVRAVMA